MHYFFGVWFPDTSFLTHAHTHLLHMGGGAVVKTLAAIPGELGSIPSSSKLPIPLQAPGRQIVQTSMQADTHTHRNKITHVALKCAFVQLVDKDIEHRC